MRQSKALQAKKPLKAKTTLKAQKPLRAQPPKPKKRLPLERKPLNELRGIADDWFSWYVRLRDSVRIDDVWVGGCITCNKKGTVAWVDDEGAKRRQTKQVRFAGGWDCGHFVGRDCWATRYEEENNNLQCSFRCNKMRSGEYQKYKAALRLKYGDEVPERLEMMAEAQPSHTYKHSRQELLQIIHDAKEYIRYLTEPDNAS